MGDRHKMETGRLGRASFCSRLQKEKVEPAFLPDQKKKQQKKQHNNKNPEECGMSDVTEQRSQADKRGAPLPHPPRRARPQKGAPAARGRQASGLETFPL